MSVPRFEPKKLYRVTEEGPLKGFICKLSRPRIADNGSWMEALRDLPEECTSFPKGDSRFRHFLLYPEDAEVADKIDAKMAKAGYP